MKLFVWLSLTVVGSSLLLHAYAGRARPDPMTPWSQGVILLGPGLTGAPPASAVVVTGNLRMRHGSDLAEALLKAGTADRMALETRLRPKLVELSLADARIDDRSLQSGRLPRSGDEFVAGAGLPAGDEFDVKGKTLKRVGVLKPDLLVFDDCYLVGRSDQETGLFSPGESEVHTATFLGLGSSATGERKLLRQLVEQNPPPRHTLVMPMARLGRRAYYEYLGGQALFLLGGSGLLISLYRRLAGWLSSGARERADDLPLGESEIPPSKDVRPRWYLAPLVELSGRPRLVWGVHLVYFGLVMLGAIFIYELPEVQTLLMSQVQDQLSGKQKGLLSVAGAAYASRNIAAAALVTFLVNFLAGSIAFITLPSIVLPGSGALLAVFRSLLWGILLGPTTVIMARGMIPHTGTLLLEGEGYILATIFGLLIPVYLVQPSVGGSLGQRFRRALTLNLQANGLIAVVLAVAAVYEAVEVIWMAG